MAKNSLIFSIVVVCIIIFSGCSENILNDSKDNKGNLDEWLGEYSFYELYPPDINMLYDIKIFKEDDDYYANIIIDGFQTNKRIRARVLSLQEGITLVFDSYLSESTGEKFINGDELLGFNKVDSELHTNWGKIEPILLENKTSDEVYFTSSKE